MERVREWGGDDESSRELVRCLLAENERGSADLAATMRRLSAGVAASFAERKASFDQRKASFAARAQGRAQELRERAG
eukprot:7067904-Prymnesium_polylepis.1